MRTLVLLAVVLTFSACFSFADAYKRDHHEDSSSSEGQQGPARGFKSFLSRISDLFQGHRPGSKPNHRPHPPHRPPPTPTTPPSVDDTTVSDAPDEVEPDTTAAAEVTTAAAEVTTAAAEDTTAAAEVTTAAAEDTTAAAEDTTAAAEVTTATA